MKKLSTLLISCFFALLAHGQTPYTINTSNFPVFDYQFFERKQLPVGYNLVPSVNGAWNLSSIHTTDTVANFYIPETDPFYTNAGINVYIDDFKSLTSNLGYYIFYEYDFNFGGVEEKGIYVNEQRYGIGGLTGNNNDSLIIPFQGAVYPSGRKVMQFPATYQSSWRSQSHRSVDFNLTVTAAGLNNTPIKHVFTIFRADSIAGWGQMRVYANGAPSLPYNVLIDRITQYTVDSFYVGGFPAPAALLAPFGMTQGQTTGFNNRYNVFRQGFSCPLAIFNYGTNNFITPNALFVDVQNLTPTTGVNTPKAEYATLLYPNPCTQGELHLQILGNAPTVERFEIYDQQGRAVFTGETALDSGALHLNLQHQLPNGSYVLRVLDDKKQTVITEPFLLEQQ